MTGIFEYSPLLTEAHIRLLWVHANPQNGNLSFELKSYSPEEVPEYQALSYAWGNSVSKDTILCNRQHMKIGATLHEALRNMYAPTLQTNKLFSLRRRLWFRGEKTINLEPTAPLSTETPIWIDAICINQRDNDEKGHQVQRMTKIYKNAKRVVVWLGLSENNSDLAMDSIPDLGYNLRTTPINPLYKNLPIYNLPAHYDPIWVALGNLFRRRWFGRLWVFQEVVLAREILVVCGRKTIKWQPFSLLAMELYRTALTDHCYNYQDITIDENGILAICGIVLAKSAHEKSESRPLAFLIYAVNGKLVTDLRDKVYGVLGLAEKDIRDAIVISYDDNSEEGILRTYIDCAKACIQSQRNPLYVLEKVAGRKKISGLPSWCPNLMVNSGGRSSLEDCSAGILSNQAVPNTAKVSPGSDVLLATGFRVDSITNIVQVEFPGLKALSKPVAQQLVSWEERCLELARDTFTSSPEHIPLGHLYTLTAKVQSGASEGNDDTLLQAYHDNLFNIRTGAEDGNGHFPPQDRLGDFNYFWERTYLACYGRKYFSTKGGRTGIGPPEMRAGDVVCVLYNSGVLFILRPTTGEKGDGWLLIGDAYVYGLMELSETLKGERGEDEVFNIF